MIWELKRREILYRWISATTKKYVYWYFVKDKFWAEYITKWYWKKIKIVKWTAWQKILQKDLKFKDIYENDIVLLEDGKTYWLIAWKWIWFKVVTKLWWNGNQYFSKMEIKWDLYFNPKLLNE